jgi:hypothetical protein
MKSVTVIIGWYGDIAIWNPFIQRALWSVLNQSIPADRILISKGDYLQDARNAGLNVDTQYIIFLDADDELDYHYIKSMLSGEGDIRVPFVRNIYPDGTISDDQRWYTPKNLIEGQNYIVIGPMINTELFKKAGGFRNLPSLEDYDLWLRMEEAGAVIKQCTNAIYKVHQRENSRSKDQNAILNQIVSEAKQRRKIA